MKKVFDPKSKQVIIIDETKEKDWMTKYWHNSGIPFSNEAEKSIGDESKPVSQEELDAKEMKQLHKKYKIKHGKEVAVRYKNDKEWILSKL